MFRVPVGATFRTRTVLGRGAKSGFTHGLQIDAYGFFSVTMK